ncbi:SH3 domain-containing protein [Aliarcobacter skirrowii]|uniref:hypothetical protein n=1 Tax=Aliarcobacter skirrowii TaxID=28200 RepID=UPI0029ABB0EB|nr:hypothetical protein [Aliarcobacter skirrowii]MDX4028376.1 hypothetical protein [Aliarcobacter skirrowii]
MEQIFNKFSKIHKNYMELMSPLSDIQNNLNNSMLCFDPVITSKVQEVAKLFSNSNFKLFQENEKKIIELYKPILNNDLKIVADTLMNQKIFDSTVFKIFQENQQIFEEFIKINKFNIPTFEIEKYFNNIDEIDYDCISEIITKDLTKEEKDEVNNLIDLSFKNLTNDKFFEKLSIIEKKKIINYLFTLIFVVIPSIIFYYELIQNKAIYFVNRDNVKIRETPTSETDKNIMKELNRNEYVIKIDSKGNWVKVKYNLEDGKEIEGWIYNTKLSKID